jgi:hypothetical protein
LGIYLAPLNLVWTSTLTADNQTIPQTCQITWNLYAGTTSIYAATSPCNGAFEIPLLLNVGDYRLVGEATIGPGLQAQQVVALQIG